MALGLKLTVALLLLLGFTFHSAVGRCSVKHCIDSSRCVLSKDERSCRCVLEYYGDKCDKKSHIQVTCGRDYIAIRALEDFFKYYKVPLHSLHLPNKACHLHREKIHNVPYYVSRISKDQYLKCGGMPLEKNTTHILYQLSLQSDPRVHGNVIRDPGLKIDYTCGYPYIRNVSLGFPIIPFSSETVIHVNDVDAKIQLMLYMDEMYTEAYTSAPVIELGSKVYVEVVETEPRDSFLLLVSECWGTQTPQTTKTANATEEFVHALLFNGCATDETVSFINGSLNGEGSAIRFRFEMFRFATEPNVYLHCTVQLCERDDYTSCTPNCNSISKREAVRSDDNVLGLLSYGPIQTRTPDKPLSGIWTVVLPVAGLIIAVLFLIIIVAVAKAGKKRLTKMEK